MAKVTAEKYEMEYQPDKNLFHIRVWGFYSMEDGMAFIKDYNTEAGKFDPRRTSMVIDSTELITSRLEAKATLVECIKLYMQLPYKNRIFIKPKSPTAVMMIKAAMKTGGMTEGKDGLFLEDMDAVLEYVKVH